MLKILLSLTLIIGALFASTSTDITNYSKYKKEYFSAILNGDKNREIRSLKKLIYFSKKLNKPVSKYQKELNLLEKNIKISSVKTTIKPKIQKKRSKAFKDSIKSVKVEKNTIVIDFRKNISKKDIKFLELRKNRSYRDEFIVKGTLTGVNKMKLKMPFVSNLKRIAIYKSKQNSITISLRGKKNLKTIYIIAKKRIIIKVLEPISKRKQGQKATLVSQQMEQKTIVIDPGHGGKDAGAVGPYKRYEKVAVLKVANKLAKLLRARGYKVYLTRTKDKYKRLKYRTSLANKKKADLFISIHANAVPKRKAHKIQGIETYYLSPARSARAKRVAALENKADLKSMGYGSKDIFLMTLNRAKINASQRLAMDVQNNILHNIRKKYRYIKDKGVRKGPFWILVGAQMPAILVEIGYISHPIESKRLFKNSYQNLLARGIANGVDSYFIKNQH